MILLMLGAAVVSAISADHVPSAIEYPLAGDDLAAVTRAEVEYLRTIAAASSGDCA